MRSRLSAPVQDDVSAFLGMKTRDPRNAARNNSCNFIAMARARRSPKILIGTSGWHYHHWIGTFYPSATRPAGELEIFSKQFSTVEINNSFYRMPDKKTFEKWKSTTPGNFIFAVKASRFITHMKKLKDTRQSVRQFLNRASMLGKKLGPVLFQLPPRWTLNIERLTNFLAALPPGYRYAFEFRDHSWYSTEVLDALKKYRCAFCIYELDGHMSPIEITAPFVYVRLHGPGHKYQGSYPEKALERWAVTIRLWTNAGKDVYIYFDNDEQGFAALNAKRLTELLRPNVGAEPALIKAREPLRKKLRVTSQGH